MGTTIWHITKAGKHGVFGHATEHCDANGCSGDALFLKDVNPEDVAEGIAYEIDDETGEVVAEITE